MIKRIKTGIPGFDKIIEGGLIENSVNLISGGTGTGKTIFCLQFLHSGAKDLKEKGIYISFEESENDLKADAAELGLNFDKLSNEVKFIHIPPYKISDFLSVLKDEIMVFEAKRVVIDPLSAIAMPMEDDFERRKQIYKVKETLKSLNCTSMLTSEITSEGSQGSEFMGNLSRFEIEEFLCDSVTVLYYSGIGGEADRAIRVIKMRKTNHARGPIPMEMGQGGMKVLGK